MGIVYSSVEKIEGPLIFVKYKHPVKNGTIVRIKTPTNEIRMGRILSISEEMACIEVFQGTSGLDINTEVTFLGELFSIGISKEMRGLVFDGKGNIRKSFSEEKKDEIIPEVVRDINGPIINPIMRDYPRDIIQTGISIIDGLNTLVRGQKLPIFSGQGLPHNLLAAQLVKQAKIEGEEPFIIIFVGIGIVQDDVMFFLDRFKEAGVMQNVISFLNLASDPTIERILVPRIALTVAEYFAFDLNQHVLVILNDMTNYCEALRELSSAKGEIPSRKGFPGYMYSDLASIYERAGLIKGFPGSITEIPIISMPNDDISHPIPDVTGYNTEGQIVLSREMNRKGIYPPVDMQMSFSRLMQSCLERNITRDDHLEVSDQLNILYSESLEAKELESIIGTDGLSHEDKLKIKFNEQFEKRFISQDYYENRSIEETLNIGWELFSNLPKSMLSKISKDNLEKYYRIKER